MSTESENRTAESKAASDGEQPAELVLLAQGVRYMLRKRRTTLGRHPKCDIVLKKDDRVSRQHAEIQKNEDRYTFLDKSYNGSHVNGEKVKEVQLQDGDEIRLGKQYLTFYQKSGPNSQPECDPATMRAGTNLKLLKELYKEVADEEE